MAYAGVIAFIVIAIIMIAMYRLTGFIAVIALAGQLGLAIAAVSGYFTTIPSFTMTLPGIAGLILSIGMGVDCNVITAERITLREYGVTGVDGIVLDLGVSSYQLDTEDRGFSYRFDAPLDMRMDRRQTLTARDIVNNYSEMELYHIIRDYGEDPFAKNIAKHIVKNRADKPIETTFELNEIIKAAVPAKMRQNGHPSKQTFQAIRIECNQELEVLKKALDELIDLLHPGGRFCIITFHSLEDRIVKNAFRRNENPCTCPPEFPVCVCGKVSKGKVITRKPILPGAEELEVNSRSKSAKLRVFEKK